jgi:hypothetical protein
MLTIYKYPLKLGATYDSLGMPKGAKILRAEFQNNILTLWAMVDTELTDERRYFVTFGTGHDMGAYDENKLFYISTVFITQFVFHVFEYKP